MLWELILVAIPRIELGPKPYESPVIPFHHIAIFVILSGFEPELFSVKVRRVANYTTGQFFIKSKNIKKPELVRLIRVCFNIVCIISS